MYLRTATACDSSILDDASSLPNQSATTCDSSYAPNSAQYYSVLQSTTPRLLCTNKVGLMIDPGHIWNVNYNPRRNKRHPPTAPNTAPTTKNETTQFQGKCLKTCHLQWGADSTMIWAWSQNEAVSLQLASQLNLPFHHGHFVLKILHFAPRLSIKISPSAAPATKTDTWTSPNAAPATTSDTWTSQSTPYWKDSTGFEHFNSGTPFQQKWKNYWNSREWFLSNIVAQTNKASVGLNNRNLLV